eukprot:3971028-Alexandrium_andersonii.AAC.1
MSASLVGSEMCIRDRNALLQHAWQRASLSRHFWLTRTKDTTRCERCAYCLLYTSDAADDM